jgi:endonuclease/exonuclease/phosphatase family metal-dependent hydrolase
MEIMKQNNFNWYCMPLDPKGIKIVDSGLIVFSKIPIVEYTFVAFTNYGEGADSLAEKGFQIIRLINGARIINTHLQATVSDNSKRIQFDQVLQISKHVNSNDIICGDFNIDAYNISNYMCLVELLKNNKDLFSNSNVVTHKGERIDYIFYRGKYDNNQVILMNEYTDHNALSVTVFF